MASGKSHCYDSLMIAVGVAGGSAILAAQGSHTNYILMAIGALAGVLLSPDLDQDGLTISETKVLRFFWILGVLWFLYWLIYAKLIPHRHWLSHMPIIGTAGRLLFLAPLWWLLFGRLGLEFRPELLWCVYGLVLSDVVHWIRDFM